jgi:hypothetical protein
LKSEPIGGYQLEMILGRCAGSAVSASAWVVNPTLATLQDFVNTNGPVRFKFEQSHHMEEHGGNVSNPLSAGADVRQICQVLLAFREKRCSSMLLANALIKENCIDHVRPLLIDNTSFNLIRTRAVRGAQSGPAAAVSR